jgi:hypothetical protein
LYLFNTCLFELLVHFGTTLIISAKKCGPSADIIKFEIYGIATSVSSVLFSKGSYFFDRPNSLQLVKEQVLFLNLNISGRLWGENRGIGRNQPEKKTLAL